MLRMRSTLHHEEAGNEVADELVERDQNEEIRCSASQNRRDQELGFETYRYLS